MVDPGSEVVPLGHAVHWAEPTFAEKVSAGHSSQATEPAVAEKEPASQNVHAAAPAPEKAPMGQATHESCPDSGWHGAGRHS